MHNLRTLNPIHPHHYDFFTTLLVSVHVLGFRFLFLCWESCDCDKFIWMLHANLAFFSQNEKFRDKGEQGGKMNRKGKHNSCHDYSFTPIPCGGRTILGMYQYSAPEISLVWCSVCTLYWSFVIGQEIAHWNESDFLACMLNVRCLGSMSHFFCSISFSVPISILLMKLTMWAWFNEQSLLKWTKCKERFMGAWEMP